MGERPRLAAPAVSAPADWLCLKLHMHYCPQPGSCGSAPSRYPSLQAVPHAQPGLRRRLGSPRLHQASPRFGRVVALHCVPSQASSSTPYSCTAPLTVALFQQHVLRLCPLPSVPQRGPVIHLLRPQPLGGPGRHAECLPGLVQRHARLAGGWVRGCRVGWAEKGGAFYARPGALSWYRQHASALCQPPPVRVLITWPLAPRFCS